MTVTKMGGVITNEDPGMSNILGIFLTVGTENIESNGAINVVDIIQR